MQAMLEVDEHHWWYRGRRQVIRGRARAAAAAAAGRVLDAGCGSGRTLLRARAPTARSPASSSIPARPRSRAGAGDFDVRIGRLEELPWEDGTFDLITCLDVIEHTPDDRADAAELRRVTQPGGWLLVTVPAYQALWSQHDEANHHFRRYNRRMLRAAADASRVARWSG